jgi:REP element-mobilizing transposase RayT
MPWIPDDVREQLYAYQAGIYKQLKCPVLVIGGVENHLHSLFVLSKNIALRTIVEEVKKGSSKWMKTTAGTGNKSFHWQSGYAGFSVSHSNAPVVVDYIKNQVEHHRRISFQDELRALFDRHGIEFDERYVWD